MADDNISDAGHGPARGYSGMNKHLLQYFRKHPQHAAEQESRSKSLGRTPYRRLKRRKRAARKYKNQL